jgi:sugar phosphate isomerase/epimerase
MQPEELVAWLDSYRQSVKDALRTAAGQDFRLVEANVAAGELDPRGFSTSARKHLARYLRDLGLRMDGVALVYPSGGLADPRHAEERLVQLSDALELCRVLGARRATVSLSGFGDPRTAGLAGEMLAAAAEAAERCGVRVAIDDRGDEPAEIRRRVRAAGASRLAVAIDTACLAGRPANLGDLTGLIGAAYLRDARRAGGQLQEAPLGEGEVDFRNLLGELESAGVREGLVVRCDRADAGVDDLRRGRDYIRSLLT